MVYCNAAKYKEVTAALHARLEGLSFPGAHFGARKMKEMRECNQRKRSLLSLCQAVRAII